MRKIENLEYFTSLLGILFILISFFLKVPPTGRSIYAVIGSVLQLLIGSIGILLIIFTTISLRKERSLFAIKKIRNLCINIIILIIVTGFCLLTIEMGLHFTGPTKCRQADDLLHHSYIPSCESRSQTFEWDVDVKLNSDGLRDFEILPKTNFDHRILILGDSFTWGYGVEMEDTFSQVLENKFKSKGIRLDVINAGVTSYSPMLEYLYLREKGLQYEPDIVILMFDMSDLQNDHSYQQSALFENGKLKAVNHEEKINIFRILLAKSKLAQTLNNLLVQVDAKYNKAPKLPKAVGDVQHDRYAITRHETTFEDEKAYWSRSLKYIGLIKELSEKNNIKFILSTYPYGHQIHPQEWSQGRHNFGFEIGEVYSDRPEKILRIYAEENNIPFVSMFKPFRDSNIFPLFYSYDGHFNEDGHELVADNLYSYLIDNT